MIRVKPGVSLKQLQPQMVLAAVIVDGILGGIAPDGCVITAGDDGEHKPGSLHYVGQALDFRHRHIGPEVRSVVADQMRHALGGDFDVVVEKTHYHVEFDPPGG